MVRRRYRKRTRKLAPFTLKVVVKGVDEPRTKAVTTRAYQPHEIESHVLTLDDIDREDLDSAEDYSSSDGSDGSDSDFSNVRAAWAVAVAPVGGGT